MYCKSKYYCRGKNCEITRVVLSAIIFLSPARNTIFLKSCSEMSDNDVWQSVDLRKLLIASLKQVNLRIFLSCLVWMTSWQNNFVLHTLERVVMLQLVHVTVSSPSCVSVMLTFHTKQLAHHLIWTPMQRPSIVSSVISGLIKSMQGRSSISLRSVASVVFKYLKSSKNATFNVWNVMFSLHELCQFGFPQGQFYWVSFISYKTISFTFGFLTSFMRTCLFSCFLRTLALISKVSYKSFPSASVWCITGCWRLQ